MINCTLSLTHAYAAAKQIVPFAGARVLSRLPWSLNKKANKWN